MQVRHPSRILGDRHKITVSERHENGSACDASTMPGCAPDALLSTQTALARLQQHSTVKGCMAKASGVHVLRKR